MQSYQAPAVKTPFQVFCEDNEFAPDVAADLYGVLTTTRIVLLLDDRCCLLLLP